MHKLKMYKNSPKSNLSNAIKLEKSVICLLQQCRIWQKLRKFFLFGSGGHAKACIDVIEASGLYKIAAVIYKKKNQLILFSKYKLINENKLVSKYKNFHAIIGVGQIKSNLQQKKYFKIN